MIDRMNCMVTGSVLRPDTGIFTLSILDLLLTSDYNVVPDSIIADVVV